MNNFLNKFSKNQIIVFLGIFLGLITASILYPKLVGALTKTFTQTNWSGGVDVVTTVDDNNLLDWTKFYSKTSGIDTTTNTEIKLNFEVSQP